MKTAPPVAQCIPRQQRRGPAQVKEVRQRLPVCVAITEKIQILMTRAGRLNPAVLCQRIGSAVIQHAVSLKAGQDAGLQRHRTVRLIQRPRRAAQIFCECVPIMPGAVDPPTFGAVFNPQPSVRKWPFVIEYIHERSRKLKAAFRAPQPVFNWRKCPVLHLLRGTVLKDAIGGIFQANQLRRQQHQAVPLSLNHGGRFVHGAPSVSESMTIGSPFTLSRPPSTCTVWRLTRSQ